MLLPGDPFPDEQQEYSMSVLAHTATTATVVVTSTTNVDGGGYTSSAYPSAHHAKNHHDSGLSTGAIAGIAVGSAVVVLAILAGLFLLMRRTKKLKKDLDRQAATTTKVQGRPDPNIVSPAGYGPNGAWNQQAHMSQLPPYQQYQGYDEAPKAMYKHDGSVTDMDMSARSMSPYSQNSQGQYTPFHSPDPNQQR